MGLLRRSRPAPVEIVPAMMDAHGSRVLNNAV